MQHRSAPLPPNRPGRGYRGKIRLLSGRSHENWARPTFLYLAENRMTSAQNVEERERPPTTSTMASNAIDANTPMRKLVEYMDHLQETFGAPYWKPPIRGTPQVTDPWGFTPLNGILSCECDLVVTANGPTAVHVTKSFKSPGLQMVNQNLLINR